MTSWYFLHLLEFAIVAVTALSWWRGGWAERIGSSAYLLASVLVFLLQRTIGMAGLGVSLLVLDGIVGLVFLALALRFTSLWLGGAMLLQAAQFSLHAYYFVVGRQVDLLFAVVNNVVSWGVLLAILIGTIVTWRGIGADEI